MDRRTALGLAREQLETPLWALMTELEETLRGLASVQHFDLLDPTAVGSALHSALPSAFENCGIGKYGFVLQHCSKGPCYKIIADIKYEDSVKKVNMELHCSGPKGGTSKSTHQFINRDIDEFPEFPGFDSEVSECLLFFIGYHLDGIKTSIRSLYLIFADGVDRKSIMLHRPLADELQGKGISPSLPSGPVGTKLKPKRTKERKDVGQHDRATNKRGYGSTRS